MMCHIVSHNSHKCFDIKEVTEELSDVGVLGECWNPRQ